MLPRYALANSRNVPAVRLMQEVGLDQAYGFFRTLGLHDDALPADHYGLGLAIGGMPVSLTELVRAQRAQAWQEVARRVAHEIKNPLTPIQLSAQRLRKRYPEILEEEDSVFDRCTDTKIILHSNNTTGQQTFPVF